MCIRLCTIWLESRSYRNLASQFVLENKRLHLNTGSTLPTGMQHCNYASGFHSSHKPETDCFQDYRLPVRNMFPMNPIGMNQNMSSFEFRSFRSPAIDSVLGCKGLVRNMGSKNSTDRSRYNFVFGFHSCHSLVTGSPQGCTHPGPNKNPKNPIDKGLCTFSSDFHIDRSLVTGSLRERKLPGRYIVPKNPNHTRPCTFLFVTRNCRIPGSLLKRGCRRPHPDRDSRGSIRTPRCKSLSEFRSCRNQRFRYSQESRLLLHRRETT